MTPTRPDLAWARAHIPGFAREADRAEAARKESEENRREMERRAGKEKTNA